MKTQNSKFKTQNYFVDLTPKVFLVICFTLSVLSFAPMASAEGVSLSVAPSLLQIKLYPPTEINAPVSVENTGDQALILRPELRLFRASPTANGRVEYITDPGEKAAFLENIRLKEGEQTVNNLTLAAKQTRKLQLNIQVPPETPSQDIYFSVIFLTEQADNHPSDSGKTSATQFNAGIAMNVILSIGDSQPNATIETFSAPRFVQKGPIIFTVKVQNKGSEYIRPKGNIVIKNMFGQTIGKVDLDSETILADGSRYLGNSGNDQTQPKAVWNEKFLLGFYEARVTVQPTSGAIPLTQTIRFTALPIRLVVGFIVAILLGVTIYHRVKAKMRER